MKKIMFNDRYGLTQAVLDGRKTQTRRLIPQSIMNKIWAFREEYYGLTMDYLQENELFEHYFFSEKREKLPYNIGEVVAVAQSYKDAGFRPDKFLYRSIPEIDGYIKETACCQKGWNNKMFVAPNLMPHQIRITNVRVERLQDISDEDCLAEGIKEIKPTKISKSLGLDGLYEIAGEFPIFDTAKETYAYLIDKISDKGTWDRNPYVWVYDFELIQ